MKLAWLVSGPSGSGKSTWIRERAAKRGARLLRHAVRTDRSLRQGRQYLFSQHRSKEPTLIWLEGADTLTTDAQAFLRRILETAAPNVEFALEVRDETTMNPPLLSRCQRISMPNTSFRKQAAIAQLEKRGYADLRRVRSFAQLLNRKWNYGPQDLRINRSVNPFNKQEHRGYFRIAFFKTFYAHRHQRNRLKSSAALERVSVRGFS